MKRNALLIPLAVLSALVAVRAQSQPIEGQSLMVPDEAALGAGVKAATVPETAEQRAERLGAETERRDRDQWRAYRQLTGGDRGVNEGQNTAAVLAQYQSWIATHPNLSPPVAAEAGIIVSRLQRKSGDAVGATATLDELWEQTKESDGALSVRAEQAKLNMEAAAGGDKAVAGAAAQGVLEPLLERAIASSRKGGGRFVPARDLLQQYSEALKAQNKGLEQAAFAQRVLLGAPEHLVGAEQNESGWLYQKTIETLLGDARPAARAAALSWAKLHWVERTFDARGVSDGSKWVAQALLAQPDGTELLAQWVKAQKEPGAPNPLQKVALPATEPGALAAALQQLGEGRSNQVARTGLLLWMGAERAAMESAIAGADKIPQNATAERQGVMREVARVFKAHDLNIKGANAYLAWIGKPQGENPIDLFFDAVPATAATPTKVAGETP